MGSIINGKTKSRKEILLALTQVLTTNNWDTTISDKASSKALEDALIEITYTSKGKERHLGSGVMLTENGLFVTASHVAVQNRFTGIMNVYWRTRRYSHYEVIWHQPSLDVALCYISTNNPYKVIKFKTIPGRFTCPKLPITLMALRNGQIYKQLGKIVKTGHIELLDDGKKLLDAIETDAYTIPGFSGSPAIHDNRLLGLCSYGIHKRYEQIGYMGLVPTENIELCISGAFQSIGQQVGLR